MTDLPTRQNPAQPYPVIVVGSGLGGSAAAAFLSHVGVPAVVLERHDEPPTRPRAWIISARTQELFRQLGLDAQVRTLGTPGSWNLQVVDSLRDVSEDEPAVDETADVSPTGSAMCDQDLLEEMLRDHAGERGATVQWGQTVTDLKDLGDFVEVHRADGPPLQARFVIVAEGGGAKLLSTIGITSTVPDTSTFDFFDQILFRSEQLDRLMAAKPGKAFFCRRGNTIVFRRDRARWQIQAQGRDFTDPTTDIATAVGQHVDVELLDHSRWTPTARLADTFRSGNIFVIGDAAHSMPPSLGMAGNLAIADAHNLAWKLSWVLAGRAGRGLLDSYEPERRPVDELVLRQALAATRGEQTMDTVTLQLGLGYPPGPSPALIGNVTGVQIVDPKECSPTIGARLPHQWLADNRTTLDLVDLDSFVAVGSNAPSTTAVRYGHIPPVPGASDTQDLWLVRPDGHVAARTTPGKLDETLRTVLDQAAAER